MWNMFNLVLVVTCMVFSLQQEQGHYRNGDAKCPI